MRPVSSRTSSSARSARSSRSSNSVTASRGVAVSSEWRVPVAAIAADRRLDPPRARARLTTHEREVAPLDLASPDQLAAGARAPRASGRPRAGPTCLGRAGERSPVGPRPRPRRRARGGRARACRSRAHRRGGRRARRACRRRADARPPTPTGMLHLLGRESLVLGQLDLDLLARRRPDGSSRRRSPSTRDRRRPSSRSARAAGRDLRTLGEDAVEPRPRVASQGRESGSVPSARARAVGGHEGQEEERHADDDERVGEVERRPVREVEEVGDVARGATRSRRFETLPPSTSPSATGSSGWRRPERAKKRAPGTPPRHRSGRSRSTSRSRTGRTRCRCCARGGSTAAPPARRRHRASSARATICFVSWSAATAAAADEEERQPLRRPGRKRPLRARTG